MSSLATALLAELTEDDLVELAERLRPMLAASPAETKTDRWLRGATAIAEYLACPRGRVYALVNARRLPVQRDGSALLIRTSDLDRWLEAGGAKRP